jgi:hypothetical protein
MAATCSGRGSEASQLVAEAEKIAKPHGLLDVDDPESAAGGTDAAANQFVSKIDRRTCKSEMPLARLSHLIADSISRPTALFGLTCCW